MKKILLSTLVFMCASTIGFSQQMNKLRPAEGTIPKVLNNSSNMLNTARTMTCQDTINYPFVKEQLLGTPTYFSFGLYNVDNEAMSQTFFASTTALQIKGVEVVGMNNATDGISSAVVRAQIFNVNASNNPIGAALTSGTVTVTSTSLGVYYINFATPANVTANYAVVIDVTNLNGVFDLYVNNAATGQSYDEDFARFKSSWSGYGSGGNWIPIPSIQGLGGTYNFEPLVGPIVSYGITTTGNVTPTTACLGTPVNMNNTTSNSYVSNRMYNLNVFNTHFAFTTHDSTYAWVPNLSDMNTILWDKNTSYTYPSAGSFMAGTFVLSGFQTSCVDNTTFNITINPVQNASFNYANSTLCIGGANVTPATVATPGGTFSSTSGLNFTNATTGEINLTTSAAGTYTVTYTTAGPCPSTATQNITITSSPDATFNYALTSYCQNASNPVPTITGSAGVFTGSLPGLSINGATGVINLAGSTPGAYTVTNTINSAGCPVTTHQATVTVNAMDDASFAYANTTICLGGANVTPSTVATPGGTFSSTTGLNFVNSSTGEINLTTSTAGPYTVTYSTNATCPNTGTQVITLINTPDASFTYAQAQYCQNAANPSPTISGTAGVFTGSLPGLSINGATGVINLAGSTPGIYTVTNTIAASGTCPAAVETASVEILAAPDATVVSNMGPTLSAQATGVTYQWYDCATNTAIPGATSQTFTASAVGSYKVVVDNGDCSAESTCYTVSDAGIAANNSELLTIFPNPTANNVIIKGLSSTSSLISVVDLNGKVLSETTTTASEVEVSLVNFVNGIYFVKVQSNAINGIVKVVKK